MATSQAKAAASTAVVPASLGLMGALVGVPASVSQMKLGEIKDFASLASESQNQGLPIAEVGTQAQQAEACEAFKKIANQITRRTGK